MLAFRENEVHRGVDPVLALLGGDLRQALADQGLVLRLA